ncbi:MAG TPA: hypothetical protein VMB25_05685 [Bryobacteraceae bacterium]|nr:hypothetical protein [Bryobacteraceae bacterium]
MHQLPIEQQIFLVFQDLALVVLCVRLWRAGLHKVYVYFFSYLLVELLEDLVPLVLPLESRAYRNAFVAFEMLFAFCYALIVLELYSVILRDLSGIASLSRRYVKVVLGIAILVSFLPAALEKSPDTVTGYLFIIERPLISSLVVLVLLLAVFLVYYPVPLNRNVICYLAGYAVWFLAKAVAIFLNNLGYHLNELWGSFLMAVYAACLLFWIAALSRAGEAKTMVVGHRWNRAEETRLLSQLEAINDSLLRAVRK